MIDFIMPIFKETNHGLFRDACRSMFWQTIPCRKVLGYSSETPEKLLEIAHEYDFDEFIQYPEFCNPSTALMHKWLYDRSKADFVAFNQGDDQSAPERLEKQLEMFVKYPKIGICFSGFFTINNEDYWNIGRDWFKYVHHHLFNIGYPSCWMLDKHRIPTLTKVTTHNAPCQWEWDFYILIPILLKYESVAMKDPLVQYHMHEANETAKEDKKCKDRRFKDLVKYFSHPEIRNNIQMIYVEDFKLDSISQFLRDERFSNRTMTSPLTGKKILVIGYMRPETPGPGLAKGFEQLGNKVWRFSLDRTRAQDIGYVDGNIFDLSNTDLLLAFEDYLDVDEIIKMFDVEFDFVFIVQTNVIEDITKVDIPVYWYYKELSMHWMPHGQVEGLFFAFSHGYQEMHWMDAPQLKRAKFCQYLPYAIDSDVHYSTEPNFEKRERFLGFMGAVKMRNRQLNTQIMNDIYNNRNRFVTHARDYLGCDVMPSHSEFREDRVVLYRKFLNETKIVLNVPGNWGWLNLRQFEAPANGAVILHWDYNLLYGLGFCNRINCLLFKNDRQLTSQIKWAERHPKELAQIAKNGQKLVREHHTWTHRAHKILDVIKRNEFMAERDRKRKEWQERFRTDQALGKYDDLRPEEEREAARQRVRREQFKRKHDPKKQNEEGSR